MADPVQILILLSLFVAFLFSEHVANSFGSLLDTLPIRIAACIMVLASASIDKFIAIGVFMVITAVYVRHHQGLLDGADLPKNSTPIKNLKSPDAMDSLMKGGHADESDDQMDFVSKDEDQDNEFHKASGSIDEKHALETEGLGSKSQSLFPDDSRHASSLMKGNQDGASD